MGESRWVGGTFSFMAKGIAAEKVRARLRHAVVCPNVTGRTKHRTAQSKRAKTEKEALKACDSPFILHLVETSQDINNVSFVTELLVEGNIHKIIKSFDDKGLTAAHVLFYAVNVIEALAHVHSRGYAHRDLKPENLMIDAQGYIRIVDMGMARRIPHDAPDENMEEGIDENMEDTDEDME